MGNHMYLLALGMSSGIGTLEPSPSLLLKGYQLVNHATQQTHCDVYLLQKRGVFKQKCICGYLQHLLFILAKGCTWSRECHLMNG